MRALRRAIKKLILRRRLREELAAELAHHRELSKQHGNPIGLGNPALVMESVLDQRRFALIENAWRDGLLAFRRLRKNPAYAITAISSIALGVGVSTAMFTILNAVALRPLTYASSEQLIWVTQVLKANSTDEVTFTPDFLDWRSNNRVFDGLAAYNEYTRSLTGAAEPVQVHTVKASSALLPVLGIRPFLGRNLPASADTAGNEKVALVSYSLWRSRFASDSSMVGKPVLLDGEQYIIAGILPQSFEFPGPEPIDIITGLGKNEAGELARDGKVFTIVRNIVGRLKPGVTREQARQNLMAIQAHLPLPPWSPTITIKMIPLRDHLFGNARTVSFVLVCGSLLFLLIASTNVGSLLLVQLMQRDREVAIRRVLGATRRRVLWQISIEGGALACLAIVPAVLVTLGIRSFLLAFGPYRSEIFHHLSIDLRVAAFGGILLLATILILGALPALRMSDFNLGSAIASGGQISAGGKRHNLRLLSLVGALEIAIVVALSTGAALMLKSFWNMRYKDLGFASQHAMAVTMNLGASRYNDRNRESTFISNFLERTAAIPGVEAVAPSVAGEIPPGTGLATNTIAIEGRTLPANSRHKALAKTQETNVDYFRILQIPLLEGRLLRNSDLAQAAPVVVVNNQFAHRYFPGENALGHRLRTGGLSIWSSIVGVVGDVRTSGPAALPEPTVYTPYQQSGGGLRDLGVLIRSALPVGTIAPSIRRIVRDLDPEQPISNIETLDQRLNASVSRPRFAADVLSTFSCFGVLLAIVGVYGVLACRTRAQIREIAVRQALGAQPADIMTNVLAHAVRIVLPGLLAGLALAMAGNRLLVSLLFGVKPADPAILILVSCGITIASLAAAFLPAFRASRLDPLVSLREN